MRKPTEKQSNLSKRGGRREGAGRKVGIPNKINQGLKELIDEKINPEQQFELLADMAIAGNARCLEVLLAYRWGKPKESIELTGLEGSPLLSATTIIIDTHE